MCVKRRTETETLSFRVDGVLYVSPLAHIVVRVSASVNIVVPMIEAIKEALALHTLRKGDRERKTERPIRSCGRVYLLNESYLRKDHSRATSEVPNEMSNLYLNMLSCPHAPHVLG